MMFPVTVVIPCREQEGTLPLAQESAYRCGAQDVTTYYDTGAIRAGVCYARNNLIKDAKHDLICCLDADDLLLDLESMYNAWQPGTFVYGNWKEVSANGERIVEAAPAGMITRKPICTVTSLFHRDDWLRVGGFDPDFFFAEDWAFFLALHNAGVKGVKVDATVMCRTIQVNQRTLRATQWWETIREIAKSKGMLG